jgi:hypothetical protein
LRVSRQKENSESFASSQRMGRACRWGRRNVLIEKPKEKENLLEDIDLDGR